MTDFKIDSPEQLFNLSTFLGSKIMLSKINNGLNYFGYRNGEYTSLGWEAASKQVTKMLKIADRQAKNINDLLGKMSFKNLMKENINLFTQSMTDEASQESIEVDRRILLEKSLKEDAIQVFKPF